MSEADNIRWNMWQINAKGQRTKWLGQITDPETGFEWIKKQGKKATQFVVNNVPPSNGAMQNPTRVVQGMKDGSVVRTGEVMMPRSIPGKTDVLKTQKKRPVIDPMIARPFDWSEYDRKQEAMRPQRRAESAVLGAPKSKPVPKVEVDAGLADAAKANYSDIKRDEAKDMERETA